MKSLIAYPMVEDETLKSKIEVLLIFMSDEEYFFLQSHFIEKYKYFIKFYADLEECNELMEALKKLQSYTIPSWKKEKLTLFKDRSEIRKQARKSEYLYQTVNREYKFQFNSSQLFLRNVYQAWLNLNTYNKFIFTENLPKHSFNSKLKYHEHIQIVFPFVSYFIFSEKDSILIHEDALKRFEEYYHSYKLYMYFNITTAKNDESGHANIWVIDFRDKTQQKYVYLFDPHGFPAQVEEEFKIIYPNVSFEDTIKQALQRYPFFQKFDFIIEKSKLSFGLQTSHDEYGFFWDHNIPSDVVVDGDTKRTRVGYCVIWSLIYLTYCLMYDHLSPDEVYQYLYNSNLHEIRENFLERINHEIGDMHNRDEIYDKFTIDVIEMHDLRLVVEIYYDNFLRLEKDVDEVEKVLPFRAKQSKNKHFRKLYCLPIELGHFSFDDFAIVFLYVKNRENEMDQIEIFFDLIAHGTFDVYLEEFNVKHIFHLMKHIRIYRYINDVMQLCMQDNLNPSSNEFIQASLELKRKYLCPV
jgi:hypothetical protein